MGRKRERRRRDGCRYQDAFACETMQHGRRGPRYGIGPKRIDRDQQDIGSADIRSGLGTTERSRREANDSQGQGDPGRGRSARLRTGPISLRTARQGTVAVQAEVFPVSNESAKMKPETPQVLL